MQHYQTDDIKVGDVYGIQQVLEVNVHNPNSKAKELVRCCKCKCILCGKISYKQSCNLINGKANSCRCRTNEATRIRNKAKSSVKVGNQYGYLQVLEDLGYRQQTRGKNESWYRCKCHNCGNTNFEVNGNNLQSGGTTSCGCVHSRGENLIQKLLQQNNINFAKEYSFTDLVTDKGYVMRFDFAVFENDKLAYLIEFDGRQHYDGPEAKWTNGASKEEIEYKDNLKNQYCKEHNIKLKRIPYYDIGKITIQTLQDDTFTI